jgi:hypothetical protein
MFNHAYFVALAVVLLRPPRGVLHLSYEPEVSPRAKSLQSLILYESHDATIDQIQRSVCLSESFQNSDTDDWRQR